MMAFRICVAMLLSGLSTSVVMAQGQPSRNTAVPRPAPTGRPQIPSVQRGEQPRQERPQPARANPGQDQRVVPVAGVEAVEPAPIKPLSPELRKILDDWGASSAEIREMRGWHTRIVIDEVFGTEKRSEGHFYYEAPDRGRIDIEPMKCGPKDRPTKPPRDNVPYTVSPDRGELWICTGEEVVMVDMQAKEKEVFPLPPDLQGTNIINGPLPFLFGMKSSVAQERFDLELQKYDAKSATAWIRAVPRQRADQSNYSEAVIILDTKSNLPKAVKLLDPAGTKETRYMFRDLQPNGTGLRNAVRKLMGDDPFRPNLNAYRTIQPPLATPAGGPGDRPAPRAVKATAEGTGRARLE